MSWRDVTLGEVVTLQRGYDLTEGERKPGRIPVVSSAGISGHHAEAKVSGPGVVTGRYGTLGRVYFIREDFWPHNTTLFVKDFHGNDQRFVYYLLGALKLADQSAVSAVPGVNRNDLHRLSVSIPTLPIQRRIAEILGRLDDKIEVNRRINRTLEAMAQALYRHWFVEFGPFRDGEFVESELGAIPKGWEIRSVYDQAQFVNGASLLQFQPNEERRGLPIVKIVELKAGITRETLFTEREMDSKYRMDDGEILFSWSGNPDTSIDVFIWTGGPAWLNQHIFRVVPFQPEEKYVVYYGLKHMLPIFAEIARNKQTTGLGHVTVGDLKSLQVVLPPSEIIGAFNSVVGPLYKKYYLNLVESRKLTETRDYLLPKLLAGEIRIDLTEDLVGESALTA